MAFLPGLFGDKGFFGAHGGLSDFLINGNPFKGPGEADATMTLGGWHFKGPAHGRFDPSADPSFADIDPNTGRPYDVQASPLVVGSPQMPDSPFPGGMGGYTTPLSPRMGGFGSSNPSEQLLMQLQQMRMRGGY